MDRCICKGAVARRLLLIAGLAAGAAGLASCMETSAVPDTVRSELAAAGTLRAALNTGNAILVSVRPAGPPAGVAADLAADLARRLGVPLALVPYPSAAAIADDAASGRWDVAFIGSDPARENSVIFSAPYVELPSTYLVPAGSAIASVADVDVAGVRVAARPRTAYDLVLRRILSKASLVYPEDGLSDLALLTGGRADALAGLRQVLADIAATLPGSRVLNDDFAAIQQAIAVPRGRAAAAAYLESFVADITSSGLVAAAIERNTARGAVVAGRVR